ncbi:hypothetical protein UlMin_041951 [Ulmus minor]
MVPSNPTSSYDNLRSVFLGERNGLFVSSVLVPRVGFLRKSIECKESRIGKQPVEVTKNVTITLEGQDMKVKGPLGELLLIYPREVNVDREESGIVRVKKAVETRRGNQIHGQNLSKGFEKRLQLVAVGYRATLEGQIVVLSLGFSHPIRMEISDGIKVKVEDNTRIVVSGYDECYWSICCFHRKWRPPEPYKVKGVKYIDEIIRGKEGKSWNKK